MNAQGETEKLAENLLNELDCDFDSDQFFIPEWKPQDCAMAIRWLKSQVWESFSVSFEVDAANKKFISNHDKRILSSFRATDNTFAGKV